MKRALVVGINNYPPSLRRLRYCVHDAHEMENLLSMPEFGFEIETLLDDKASRRDLRRHLEALFRESADTYLFYFSGHGWADDVGVYLVPVDGDKEEKGIELDYLRRLITNVAPPRATVIVILDCCHSGAAAPGDFGAAGGFIRPDDVVQAVPSLAKGRVVLAACRQDQVAYDDSRLQHSVFTSVVLNGLVGDAADHDGTITVTGLFDYIAREFHRMGFQDPVLRGDISGRVILGEGFLPTSHPGLTEESAHEMERKAEALLSQYQAQVAPLQADLSAWRLQGHKTACQLLEPILVWFDRKAGEHPELASRAGFAQRRDDAYQRLATLSPLDIGTATLKGVIERKLGGGTFGTLWKVQCPSPLPALAYKVYHAQDLAVSEKVIRFRRGYEAMKRLDHPHIVKVDSFTECPLGFYMDLIDGPNLREFIGTVEEPAGMLEILLTVAETLRHAHMRDVKHRDIKPENILLKWDQSSGKWLPYLTDFDLAWFSTATQVTREGVGTWQYSAPEQLKAPKSASAHAPTVDCYGFAQLCFFAFTGSDPGPLEVPENKHTLETRIHAGWFRNAATELVKLYSECSERNPGQRPLFDGICERVFGIMQLLKARAPQSQITVDELIQETAFSLVGLTPERELRQNSFVSMSGKTRVTIEVRFQGGRRDADLTYEFYSLEPPILEGVKTFEQLRKVLMGRIESALKEIPSTRKRYGSTAPFQVFIEHDHVPLVRDGVLQSRRVISRIIDLIEGR